VQWILGVSTKLGHPGAPRRCFSFQSLQNISEISGPSRSHPRPTGLDEASSGPIFDSAITDVVIAGRDGPGVAGSNDLGAIGLIQSADGAVSNADPHPDRPKTLVMQAHLGRS